MSIWQGIDRNAFENNLAILCWKTMKEVENLRAVIPSRSPSHGNRRSQSLDSVTEQRLAKAFAYLASPTASPSDVAAAAVLQKPGSDHLSVFIAANEGIKPEVDGLFRHIFCCLEQRAKRVLRKDAARDSCLEQTCQVLRARILERLGSTKVPNTTYMAGVKLAERVNTMSAKIAARMRSGRSDLELTQLAYQLQDLRDSISAVESAVSESHEETAAMQLLLHIAFELAANRQSLAHRAKLAGVSSVAEDSKEIRAVYGLAEYYRICTDLLQLSRRYPLLFQDIDLKALPEPVVDQRRTEYKVFVHAEIQLLTYFELNSIVWSQFIGASKKPCFLCYSLIKAHGKLGISRSHGEVFKQWTVPANAGYSEPSRMRLNSALKQVASEIQIARGKSSGAQGRVLYRHPIQTVSKLQDLMKQARNVSTSTIASIVSLLPQSQQKTLLVAKEMDGTLATSSVASIATALSAPTKISESTRSESPLKPVDSKLDGNTGLGIHELRIDEDRGAEFVTDDVRLILELEQTSPDALTVDAAMPSIRSTACRVKPTADVSDDELRVIDIQQLDEVGVILEKHPTLPSLRFALKTQSETYAIELVWQGGPDSASKMGVERQDWI